MAESLPPPAQTSPAVRSQVKHDWYQTDATVVITVLIKNITEDMVKIAFGDNTVNVRVKQHQDDDEETTVNFRLLHKIVPEQCGHKLTPSKIEIKLAKLDFVRWDKLEGELSGIVPKTIPTQGVVATLDGPPPYPTSKPGRDWSAIEKDINKEEASETPDGEEKLKSMFQQIYQQGNDDVKWAMNKSYVESGGTVLSTNWKETCKKKVDVKPPDGMEYKKWDS